MPLILGANSVSGGYEVDNSLRFNSGSSDSLTKTTTTPDNRDKLTLSAWFKFSSDSTSQEIFGFYGSNDYFTVRASNSGPIDVILFDSSVLGRLVTTQVLRDFSAWYHIVVVVDSANATADDRMKIYLNGNQITSFSTRNNPSQNQDFILTTLTTTGVGINTDQFGTVSRFNGYISEAIYVDNQALTPSSFGETDEDTGIWKPIPYTGAFGTAGFYLEFKDSSALGDDTSGNGNDFTVNNLTSVDQSTDTCTNNFATLNPIAAQAGSGVSSAVNTFTEGNLKVADLASDTAIANFGVSTGKWFWEVQVVTDQDGIAIGACNDGFNLNAELGYNSPASQANGKVFGYYGSGSKFTTIGDGTQFSAYGSAIAVNDIIGVALNLDTNEVTFYKNGSSQGTFSITALGSGENYFPAIGNWSAGAVVANFNFGSPPFTISSGNADGNGYGNFEYSVPAGYYALCTENLAQYG